VSKIAGQQIDTQIKFILTTKRKTSLLSLPRFFATKTVQMVNSP